MHLLPSLVRDPEDRITASGPIVPDRQKRGRPNRTYRLFIRNDGDVLTAQRLGVPLHVVSSELVAVLGFPMALEPVLVVWSPLLELVETDWSVQGFHRREAAIHPGLEDLIVVLLRVDPFAARSIAFQNREFLRPDRLLERVVEEHVGTEATWVELQDFCPAIPRSGPGLDRKVLSRQDRNVNTIGLL